MVANMMPEQPHSHGMRQRQFCTTLSVAQHAERIAVLLRAAICNFTCFANPKSPLHTTVQEVFKMDQLLLRLRPHVLPAGAGR